jgi:hypothetical protein
MTLQTLRALPDGSRWRVHERPGRGFAGPARPARPGAGRDRPDWRAASGASTRPGRGDSEREVRGRGPPSTDDRDDDYLGSDTGATPASTVITSAFRPRPPSPPAFS